MKQGPSNSLLTQTSRFRFITQCTSSISYLVTAQNIATVYDTVATDGLMKYSSLFI